MPYTDQSEAIHDTRRTGTDQAIYDAVKIIGAPLSLGERKLLIHQYAVALDRFENLALMLNETRRYLFDVYNEAVRTNKATSTFSRKFNMAIRGRNKELAHEVDGLFKQAFEAERDGRYLESALHLKAVGLRHSVIYSEPVEKIVRAATDFAPAVEAVLEIERVRQYREALYKSVIRMAVTIAKKHSLPLSGDCIEKADLVQEAILSAKDAVAAYQPTEDGRTFTSFVYNWISGILSKYVNENTRTVVLPRTVIDRYRPVRKAVEELGSASLEAIANRATRILHDQKQANRARKLDLYEAYTPEEVYALLGNTQDIASLDLVVSYDEYGNPNTLGDTLLDERPSPESSYDIKHGMEALMTVIRGYCTPEEYTLMELRWGMGRVKGLKTVADEYRAATGRPMNKGKVAYVEGAILGRLKRGIADGDTRLVEIRDTIMELLTE